MPKHIPNPHDRILDTSVSTPIPRENTGRRPELSELHHKVRIEESVETKVIRVAPGEVLIQDERGTLSPAEMVEQKLHALLRHTRRRGPSR